MLLNVLGFLANLTSLILWIPQAKTTYLNRHDPVVLSGISYLTQIIVCVNTSLWCIYGLVTHSFWLPIATIVVLPLGLFTIIIKYRAEKRK